MRNQPIPLRAARASGRTATPARRFDAARGFSHAAVFSLPWHDSGLALAGAGAEPVCSTLLAIFAGVLGLSASLLYRHMHRREEDLRARAEASEAELRALLMMTDEAVLVLSAGGNVRAANPAAEELFQRDAADFVGEAIAKIIAQPLALRELTRNGPANFSTTARRGDDEFLAIEMLLSPVELGGGKGFLALLHETRAEANDDGANGAVPDPEREKTIAKFTHDLNNQLTAVLGNLSLLLATKPGDPAGHQRALSAKKSAVGAQILTQKLQAFVSAEAEPPAVSLEASTSHCTILPMPKWNALAPPPAPGPSRILILDDEEAICLLVASALEASALEVTPATTVSAALAACEEAVKACTPFSLVICDLSLPGDIDGLGALQKLRAIDPDIRAIVSSGYDSDPVMRDCRKHGFDAAMAKPYEISKLMRTVREVLGGGAPALRMTA